MTRVLNGSDSFTCTSVTPRSSAKTNYLPMPSRPSWCQTCHDVFQINYIRVMRYLLILISSVCIAFHFRRRNRQNYDFVEIMTYFRHGTLASFARGFLVPRDWDTQLTMLSEILDPLPYLFPRIH